MINRLKKNISILFVLLVAVMLIVGLVMFNWMSYREYRADLKAEVRREIRYIGWKEFYNEEEELALEEVSYCVVEVHDKNKVTMLMNHYPEEEEQTLLEYSRDIAQKKMSHEKNPLFLYIVHKNKKLGKHIILINAETARKEMIPLFVASLIIGISGILLLIVAARMLSRWLVRPVENMIQSEKKFMSNASHELKTPLTVIAANADLLMQETGENKHLQYIRQETERMTLLVNRMLTLVRLDTPVLQNSYSRFCVEEAFLDVIYPMESVAYEKQITMHIQIPEKITIVGDEEQLKSVVSILLDNAISYTPEHGHISVEVFVHGRKFYLRVANTGEPIPEEARKKLFERFYRQDEARTADENHFGLGLSIASSIVSNHHGSIQVESANGENCFTVVLPMTARA